MQRTTSGLAIWRLTNAVFQLLFFNLAFGPNVTERNPAFVLYLN